MARSKKAITTATAPLTPSSLSLPADDDQILVDVVGEQDLPQLAKDVNALVATSNEARVRVGMLLLRAREVLRSDRQFGEWCGRELESDLAKSQPERHRLMAVARAVIEHKIGRATIAKLGWSALQELSRQVQHPQISPKQRKAVLGAVVTRLKTGKVTANEVLRVANTAAPEFRTAKKAAFTKAVTAARTKRRTTDGGGQLASTPPSQLRFLMPDGTVESASFFEAAICDLPARYKGDETVTVISVKQILLSIYQEHGRAALDGLVQDAIERDAELRRSARAAGLVNLDQIAA